MSDGDVEDIPCAENLTWCKGVCCSLVVHITPEDIAAGIAHEPEHPGLNAQRDGRCTHLDGGGCTVYAIRPTPCRTYDCRTDGRIWRDYERRIPNPNLDKLFVAAANNRLLQISRRHRS